MAQPSPSTKVRFLVLFQLSATFLLCVAAHDPRFRCVVVRDVGKAWNFRFGSDSSRSADAQKLPLLVGLDPLAAPFGYDRYLRI